MAIVAKKPEDEPLQAILLLRDPKSKRVTALGAKHVDAIPALRMTPQQKSWHKIITLTLEDIVPVSFKQKDRWLGPGKQE